MYLKENFVDTILLAISVCIIVTIWGTLHSIIGVELAWPAFISAALFFAMGHHIEDTLKVIIGHLVGVVWGMLFFKLISALIAHDITPLLVPVITLSVLSFSAVLLTHIGLTPISHLPSLFSGWAITVGTLSGIGVHEDILLTKALDTILSIMVGIVGLGLGIPFLHDGLKSQFQIKEHETEDKKIKSKIKPKKSKETAGTEKIDLIRLKTNQYIVPFRQKHYQEDDTAHNESGLSEIKNEIIKLSKYLPSIKANINNNTTDVYVNIVGICGSPHKNGSTIVYLRKVLEAAESMGQVSTQLISIADKNIKPCMGCKTDKCFGECKIKDDMSEIYPILKNADGIVIGSPSYFGTFTGQLKILIDRLRVMRHTNFQLANKVIAPLAVAGRRHGGQEITNLDIIQAMMRHNTIIVNDGTAVCQLGATGWSHAFDDPKSKVEDDAYGLQTCEGVGMKVVEIARAIKVSGIQQRNYQYNAKIGKR